MKYRFFYKNGFTLIELLIVVAIIAILAAIAIPNFLQAQIRAKIAQVKANMATTATGIEAYYVDNNDYPWDFSDAISGGNTWYVPITITSPVAYITSVPKDEFDIFRGSGAGSLPMNWNIAGPYEFWVNTADGTPATDTPCPSRDKNPTNVQYVIFSLGPGQQLAHGIYGTGFWSFPGEQYREPQPYRYWYDPTNGTVSIGYVVRQQGGTNSP